MKKLLAVLFSAAMIVPAWANSPDEGGFSYQNITAAAPTTTVVKTGQGIIHEICINKYGASGVITVYDNTAGSGAVIATITDTATVTSEPPACVLHDVAFRVGLTIVTSTAAQDITVVYH